MQTCDALYLADNLLYNLLVLILLGHSCLCAYADFPYMDIVTYLCIGMCMYVLVYRYVYVYVNILRVCCFLAPHHSPTSAAPALYAESLYAEPL